MGVYLCELSGGYDSAAATLLTLQQGHHVHALFIDHGQSYLDRELAAASHLAQQFAKRYANFKGLRVAVCHLSQALPDDKTPAAYVPLRNLVLGALSANKAQALGAEAVVVGSKTTVIRQDDPYSFFDCSTEFYERLGSLATLASQPGFAMRFVQALVRDDGTAYTKAEVVKLLLNADLDIKSMWNCYTPGVRPCRSCKNCIEMRDVLNELGLFDRYKGWW
jgi:7-cyano-7-deazaguanine synthase in queuosine biosynthesis